MELGKPSKHLQDYIQLVQKRTGLSTNIRPYDDATKTDSPYASLEIGPSINNIKIRFRPIRPLKDPNTERQVAHELTHALMVYSEGYQFPCAPSAVSEYDVQIVTEIVDLVDDVIVDVRIHNLGFKFPKSDYLSRFEQIATILEKASSRSQIDPYEDDPVRAEIKLVSLYIYAWAFPRYVQIGKEQREIFSRITRRFPQILKVELGKAKQVKKLIMSNDIFTVDGRTSVIVGATDLWPVNERVYLSSISSPNKKI